MSWGGSSFRIERIHAATPVANPKHTNNTGDTNKLTSHLACQTETKDRTHSGAAQSPAKLIGEALRSSAHKAWADRSEVTDEKWRVAEMLRCAPDSPQPVYRQRLETLRAAAYAAGREDALEFFDALQTQRLEWF